MKKIMYTNNEGKVCIVVPSPRDHIDRWNRVPCTVIETETVIDHGVEKIIEKEVETTRPMTDAEWEMHVWDRSVPVEFIESARWVDEVDMPQTREFRDAWRNIDETTKVNICCKEARDIALEDLRRKRNEKLDKLDKDFLLAIERDLDTAPIKQKKQELRDVTEPLKNLAVDGVFDCETTLQEIRQLRDIEL